MILVRFLFFFIKTPQKLKKCIIRRANDFGSFNMNTMKTLQFIKTCLIRRASDFGSYDFLWLKNFSTM